MPDNDKNKVKKSTSNLNSKWLQNTMKSLGVASTKVIRDLMPATSETVGTASKVTANTIKDIRSSRASLRRVQNAFNQTPIAKTAQDFFKNAIEDMKSGDFYKDRTSTGDDSDLSFGDLDNMFGDTSIEGDVNVENNTHIESSAATDAVLASINKQVEFNVKAAKAQTDTMMSLGSSMILKHNEFSGKLLSEISSIGANVAALVEYQNTNMTKLIDASIGFFEQMVPKEDVSSTDSSKVNAENIFGSNGGLDFENYLQYVKGNIADLKNGSMAGSMLSMILENKDMLFTNPMGMVAEGLIKQVIPAATKTAMQRLDQSMKDFIPVMLERLGNLGAGDNSMFGSFLRSVGGIFGIKRNRTTEFDFSKIKKGPVPYNGMANHTIVEIIPKYLRESTSYLKEIATYFTGKTEAEMNQNALGFDWSSGRFKTIGDMTTELYNQIGSEITGAYQSSDFHKYLMSRRDLLNSDADKENLESALGELELIAEQRGTLKVDAENFNAEVEDMVGNLQLASENIKEFFRAAFADAKERSDEMLGNFIATTQKASRQRNAMIKSMNEGATENGLYQVNAALTKDNIDEKTLEIYRQKHGSSDATISPAGGSGGTSGSGGGTGSGGPSPNQGALHGAPHQSKAELKAKFAERAADDRSYEPTPSGGGIRNEIGNAAARPMNRLSSVLNAIMAGNSDQAFDELMKGVGNIFRKAGNYLTTNFLGPIKKSLFGEKDDQGFLRGGIFEGVQNRLKDASFSLRRIITGKGYVDSTGKEIPDVPEEEKDKTVVGKLSKAVEFFKSSIKERLFGVKSEEGEEGEEKEGIVGKFRRGLSSVSSSLLRGLTGWKHALFGKSDDENEDEEEQGKVIYAKLKEKAKEVAPDAIAGSIGGGILGMLVGGPIGGALLGFAGGILKRSDRFQNWLFGEKDEDGERTGGFISKGVQDYFKKNGKFLTGGAILGGLSGAITGGGLLGTLVGGPIAGAIMGIGSSMLLKSDAFQKFLFGDAENGQLGIVSHIKRWTSNIGRNKETGDPEASKMFGMSAIGIGTGGILGMLVGGPIVGAIAGLGASILAQRNNFKEWLFGSVDKETGAKKEGVLGKFRNMLTVTVFHPIRNGLADIGRRTKTWSKDILGKAAIVFGDIGDGIRNTVHKITGAFGTAIGGVAKSIKENFLDNIIEGARKVFEPLTNIVTMLGKGVAAAARTIIGFPVNLLYKLTSPIAKAVSKGIGTVFSIVGKAVRIALAPVALMIKGVGGILKVAGKVVAAPFKLVSNIFNFFNEKVSALVVHVGGFFSKLGDMVYQKIDDVLLRPIREFGQHIKDAGKAIVERITRPFRLMGNFVKGIFKGIGHEISESIKQSVNRMFSILNPLNWVRALMKGGKSLIGLLTGRKPGEDNQPKKKSWLRQIWDDTKYGYQKDYSGEMVYDDDGNPINTTLSRSQQRRALENRTRIEKRKDREKKFDDRNRLKNEKLIYKYTKGQRTQDTEENRKLAEMMSGKVGGIQWKSVDPIKKIEESQLSETQSLHKTVKLIAKFLSGGRIKTDEELSETAENIGASMAKVEGKAKDIKTAAQRSGTFDSKDRIRMAERDLHKSIKDLNKRHQDMVQEAFETKGWKAAWDLQVKLSKVEREERKKYEAEYKAKYDSAMDVVADGQTTWNKATDRVIKKYWDTEGMNVLDRLKGRSRKGLINSVKRLGLMPKDWDPGEESHDATPDEAPAEGYATGTSNARRGFHILGENGPEAGFGGIFGKGRIFALNGPQVKFLTGGEQIIPNDRIEAPSVSREEQREALRRRTEIDRAKDAEITRKERESLDADKKAFLSQFSTKYDSAMDVVADGQTTWNKATDRVIKKYWDKEGLDLLWRLKERSPKGLINSVKRIGLMPKDWDPGEEQREALRRRTEIDRVKNAEIRRKDLESLSADKASLIKIEAPSLSSEEKREALRRRTEIDRAKDAEITRKERESLDADKKAFLSQFSENTDAEISRVSDTRKLSIGERLIRGLNDIKASYNEAKEIYGKDTDDNEDDSDMTNVERLKKMLKNGIFGVLGMIPGFNLLMNAAIFGKTLVGATGEVIGAGVDKVKGVATGVANRISTARKIVSGTITGFRNRQDARDEVQYDDEGNIIGTPTEGEAADAKLAPVTAGDKLRAALDERRVAQGNVCPECGAPLRPGAKFCPKCGLELSTAKTTGESTDAKLAPATVTAGDKLRAALSERKAASAENTDAKLAPVTAGDKLSTTLNVKREAIGTVSNSGAIVRDDQMYADQQAAQAAVSGRTAEAERKRREEESESTDAKLAPAPVTAGDKLRAALSERKAASAENTDAKLAPVTAGDKLRAALADRRAANGDDTAVVGKSGAIVRDDQMYADQQAAQAAVSGRTAEAERKRREEEEQKERENERADATLAEIKGLHKTEKEHSGMWNSIFSKKGLITGGLLLLGPLLMNFLKNGIGGAIINIANALKDAIQTVIDKIKPFIDKVIQFGKDLGANLIDQWNQTEVGHERENGETVGERAAQNLENLAKGHWFYDENGEVTNQTSPRAKLAARLGLNFALKHPVITATAKTAADDVAKLGGKGLSKVGGKAAQKLGPGTLGLKALDKAGSVKNPLLKKVLEMVGKFFTTISDKLFKFASFGKKSTAIFSKLSKNVTKVVTERWASISSKVSRILGVKAATLNPIGFIANAAFIGFSALNGLSGTAKLFHVNQEAVDGKMKIISTIMGGFSGTLIGAIIEVISALMADVTGVDFLSAVAVAAYNFLADDEEAAALDSAQTAFDQKYQDYRLEEIEKQYNTQKAAGLIGANMTLKEFRAATESGEIKVDYKSEDNYNTDVNASLSDKFMKGLGKGIGGIKNFFGGKDTIKYEDQSGKQYIKNADGTFEVYDKLGNDLGYIAEDAVMALEGLVDKSEHQANILKRAGSLLYKAFVPDTQAAYRNPIDGTWYDYEGNHFSAANEPLGDSVTVEELGVMVDEGILVPDTIITRESVLTLIGHPLKTLREIPKIFGMSGDTMDKFGEWLKDKGGKVVKGIGNIIGGATTGITNFFNTHKEKVFVDPTDGTYYTADGNHYSRSGLLLSVDKPISQAELKIMIDEGALLPAVKELPPNIDTKLSNIGMKMREAWNSGLERMHYLWDHKKEIATAALEKIKTGGANFAKNWIATFTEHTEKRWHSVEGGYYQSNGSVFSYYNDNGDLLQDGISAEEFAEICQSGLVTEEDYEEITVKSRIKVAVKDLREKIGSTFTSVLDKTKKALTKIANSPVGKLMAEIAQHGIFGTIGEALSKTKTGKKVWYTPEGNYYKKNGSTYSMYNMNGDVVKEGITQEEFDALRQSSVLTEEDEIVDNEAKKAIRDIKSAVKGAWKKAKSVVVSGWEKFKNWISGGEGEGKSGGSGIGPAAVAGAYGGSGNGRAIGIGGNGDVPERLNGIPYYSQNDPRWAGKSYNIMGGRNDGATIGDSGCGPAAMSMVVNDMEDKRPTPADMAKLAQRTGDRDETGTNANFISTSAKKYGISSYRQLAPSKDTIETGLSTGNPMVLLGKGDANTPYTEAGHYIVVTGMDKSGNIVYNDPRGVQYSGTIDANSVLNNTQAAWAFRDGGRGTVSDKDKPKTDSVKISPSNGYTKVVTPGNYLRYSMDGIYHSFGGKGVENPTEEDLEQNDLAATSLLDDNYDTPEGRIVAHDSIEAGETVTSSGSIGGRGSLKKLYGRLLGGRGTPKEAIQSIMNEYRSSDWTKTGSGGYGGKRQGSSWGYSGTRYHAGIDLCFAGNGSTGRAVHSFTAGTVYLTNNNAGGRGYYIIIKDDNGYYHFYQHLNKWPSLKPGATVKIGDTVGGYGSSGFSKGNHMHYEVRPPSVVNQPGGVTGTDPGHKGFILSKDELARYTVNPYTYLQQYMNGNIDPSKLGVIGATSSDSTSTGDASATTAYNTATPSYDGGLITQLTSAFGNISNALLDAAVTGDMDIDWTEVLNRGQAAQQGASLSTSTGSNSSSTSASSNVSLSGNVKSKAEAFRYMYERLHEINVPNNQIAGVLSNFDVENGGDPTSFEAYYLKYPNTGYTEDPKKLSIVGTGDSFPNWDSIDNWTRGVVWPNTKGIYKPGYKSSMPGKMVMGIGIGSWTGIGGEDLLKYAKQTGQPWYNMKTQMDYFTKGESLAKNGLIAFDKKYRTKANMSEWWKGFAAKSMTPTEAANWYFYNAEMPSGSRSQAAQHASKANYWSEQIKSWGGSGFGGRGSIANVTEAPDTLNGIPYYSQNDPRWAYDRYTLPNGQDDGSTMSNSGCGPTAMSMVINSMKGDTSPVGMAKLAQATGDRDETGTNWNFIDKAANAYGIDSTRATNPSSDMIKAGLGTGHPMILSGSGSESDSPYTDAGHYIVATGVKGNQLTYNDPRGKAYSGSMDINKVADNTSAAWAFGGGFGAMVNNIINKRNHRMGGRGTNSSLATVKIMSPNKNIGRNHAIDTITIHCMAGNLTAEQCGKTFANPDRDASSNYGVDSNGVIALYVNESDRSWCTSSPSNDNRAITIEVANTQASEPFPISDKAYDALIKLCADICHRNNIPELRWKADKSLIGQVDKQNMTVHRWFANKSCPGEWLYTHMGQIADDVNKLLGNESHFASYDSAGVADGASASTDTSATVSSTATTGGYQSFISKTASAFTNISNALMKGMTTGDLDIDWSGVLSDGKDNSGGVDASASTTSTSESGGTTPTIGNYGETQEGMARGAYEWMKQYGLPDMHIAGMLSNWNHESQIDPTAVEGDYYYFPNERYKIGPKKQAEFADLNSYTKKVMRLHHTSSSFYQAKTSQGGDNNWYAGLGLPQFTGINAYNLIKYANSIGKPWYSLETQMRYFTEPGKYYDGFKEGTNAIETWKSQNFKTPEEAAAYYYSHWEMPGKTIDDNHRKHASKWYKQAQEWSKGGGSGEGATLQDKRYIIPQAEKEPTTVDNSVTPASVKIIPHNERGIHVPQAALYNNTNNFVADNTDVVAILNRMASAIDNINENSNNLSKLDMLSDINSGISEVSVTQINGGSKNVVTTTGKQTQNRPASGTISRSEEKARKIAFGR